MLMESDVAETIHRKAAGYARRLGFMEQAEDIAQSVMLKYSEGLGQHQAVEHAVIDEVRKRFGRSEKDRENKSREISLLEEVACFPDVEDQFDVHWAINKLEDMDRVIVCLRLLWGLSGKEIGYCLGVSESRISQRLREIEKKLYKRSQ